MKAAIALVLTASLLAASPASATDFFEMTETLDASARANLDRPIDIIGVQPGMTPAEANALVAAEFDKARLETEETRIGTAEVQSQVFQIESEAAWLPHNGVVRFYFTSPISGNRVFSGQRFVMLDPAQGLPPIEALEKQLVEKYGKPTLVRPGEHYPSTELFWYFGGEAKCDGNRWCAQTNVASGYEIGATAEYEEAGPAPPTDEAAATSHDDSGAAPPEPPRRPQGAP